MQKSVYRFAKGDNIKLLLVVLLSVVLIVVLKIRMSGGQDTEMSASPSEIYNTSAETLASREQLFADKTLKPASRGSEHLEPSALKPPPFLKRDIFSFGTARNSLKREADQSAPLLKLNATITDNGKPLAIIENEVLEIGDFVKGLKVTAIRDHEAELYGDGKHYTLKMIKD